jgi:hypothetical protein
MRFLGAGSSANQVFWDKDFRQSNERSALYNSGKAAVLLSSARSMGCTMSLLAYNLTMGVTQRWICYIVDGRGCSIKEINLYVRATSCWCERSAEGTFQERWKQNRRHWQHYKPFFVCLCKFSSSFQNRIQQAKMHAL